MNPRWPQLESSVFGRERGVFMLTAAQSRELDRLALAEFGLTGLVLMENAARGVADIVLDALDDAAADNGNVGGVLIVAGPGNNGGDGLAAARHLHNAGVRIEVLLAFPAAACRGDCAVQLKTIQAMGLPAREWGAANGLAQTPAPTIVVDAIFGTGLVRALDAPTRALVDAIEQVHQRGTLVLAVDVPSGMDADTGTAVGARGIMVRADATVTFAGVKPGLVSPHAAEWVGELMVGDIGVPRELVARLGTPYVPG